MKTIYYPQLLRAINHQMGQGFLPEKSLPKNENINENNPITDEAATALLIEGRELDVCLFINLDNE